MRPDFIPKYTDTDLYEILRAEAAWENRTAPRAECFMGIDLTKTYSYGKGDFRRTYYPTEMHPKVRELMERINLEFGTEYNVCVLNYYAGQHQHLGWHADDSKEQDPNHPIAVVAFGAEREIWTRINDAEGVVPPEDRYLLTVGSLFVMPPGYQETHQHRIPKHDRPCGGRISLTFRKLDRSST